MTRSEVREIGSLIWTRSGRFVKIRLIAVSLLVAGGSILSALGPVALKGVVDGLTGHAQSVAIAPVLLMGFYVFSQWLTKSLSGALGFIHSRAEQRVSRTVYERLFAHIMQLPMEFHLSRQTGVLSQALENGLAGCRLILHHLVFAILPVMVELGTIIVVLVRLAPHRFLWLFGGALVCYALAYAYASTSVTHRVAAASAAHGLAVGAMVDGILNVEIVKYFTAEAVMQQRVSNALVRTENEWARCNRRVASAGLGVATVFGVFLGVAIIYALQQVKQGSMTIGDFVLINSYMLQVSRPAETLGFAVQKFVQGFGMLKKVLELLREKTEPRQAASAVAHRVRGNLRFETVTLSYRTGRPALEALSFELAAGKTLGIVGASGSGKSTVVRLLVRFFEPDQGRILLDGRPICELPLKTLRQCIAVVPQDAIVFDDTIGSNIGFGKEGATQAEIEQAAKLAHLHEFIMRLPDKYETRVGERGVKLSGGEKQRLSIARAAIRKAAIYVFDEATSSLDSKTEREILVSLRTIARSSTTLVIAHRLSTVVRADEIIVLESGVLVERGTHASLLAKNGRYATFWKAQQYEPNVA